MTLATRKEDRLNALLAQDRTGIVLEFVVVCGEESDWKCVNVLLRVVCLGAA